MQVQGLEMAIGLGVETIKMQRQKAKLRQECINLAETTSTKEETGNEKLMQGCTAKKQVW